MSFEFSECQKRAIRLAKQWAKTGNEQIFRLFGWAGTGKTTIAKRISKEILGSESKIAYGAYTGKAAFRMRQMGCYNASTIHSMIYKAIDDGDGGVAFCLDQQSPVKGADLIVLDEVSMVGHDIGRDLAGFGRPILVIGDPGQLPPPSNDTGYFTSQDPDAMLDEVHRQAMDSGIIRFATDVRSGNSIADRSKYGGDVEFLDRRMVGVDELSRFDQVLVGTNRSRHSVNGKIRNHLGLFGGPQEGDKVICLRNSREYGIFNGEMMSCLDAHSDDSGDTIRLSRQGEEMECPYDPELFGKQPKDSSARHTGLCQFDFGYAITTHKAQGSQWPSVAVFDESRFFRENSKRWLYTAATRAEDKLTIIS